MNHNQGLLGIPNDSGFSRNALIRKEYSDPNSEEHLNHAQEAAERGAKLIRNMLAFSRRSRLQPEQVNLDVLISNTCALCEKTLPDNIDLKVDLSGDLWPIQIDQNATENALLNLLLNARDAMFAGGRIRVKTENISLTIPTIQALNLNLLSGLYVCLTVQDNGPGISKENLQRIFDPFFTTKPPGAGTGLGLSTVLGFMQQSGGAITADATVGQGAKFRLYFPALT